MLETPLLQLREKLDRLISIVARFAGQNWDTPGLPRTRPNPELCGTCGINVGYIDKKLCSRCSEVNVVFFLPQSALDPIFPRNVTVAGSFNEWNTTSIQLRCLMGSAAIKAAGVRTLGWVARTRIPPGTYDYKFLVDQTWLCDPENPSRTRDSNGNENSCLTVHR
jgi:Glycogen recognition site of AMP-activated protein kinase